jgi:hypothetical protein
MGSSSQIAIFIMFTTTLFYQSIRLAKEGQECNPDVMECRGYVMKCFHPAQKASGAAAAAPLAWRGDGTTIRQYPVSDIPLPQFDRR